MCLHYCWIPPFSCLCQMWMFHCGHPSRVCVRCECVTVTTLLMSVSDMNVWPLPFSCLCQMWMCHCGHPSCVCVRYKCVAVTTLLMSVSDMNVSLWPPFSCLCQIECVAVTILLMSVSDMNVSLWPPFSSLCQIRMCHSVHPSQVCQMWMCHSDHPSHVCVKCVTDHPSHVCVKCVTLTTLLMSVSNVSLWPPFSCLCQMCHSDHPSQVCVKCECVAVTTLLMSESNVSLWPPFSSLCQMWMCCCDHPSHDLVRWMCHCDHHPSHVCVGCDCVTVTTLLMLMSDMNGLLWPPFSWPYQIWMIWFLLRLSILCLCQMLMCLVTCFFLWFVSIWKLGGLVSKSPDQQKGIICGMSSHSRLLLYGSFCPVILSP